MVLRIASPLLGLALLALVIWLGIRSADDSSYVIWFGLASAILAPVGLAAIGLAFRGKDQEVLRELSSVPEIQELIARAETEQERVELLEQERQRLVEIVRFESRRQALEERRALLHDDATRVLAALVAVDQEAASLRLNFESSAALPEVQALAERLEARRQGKVVIRIGQRFVAIDPDLFRALPLGMGMVATQLLNLLAAAQRRDGSTL